MDQNWEIVWNLLAALGIGLLIGIERGWTGRKEDEGERVAGIRTFSLVGLLGGVWAEMSILFNDWILGVVFLAFTALVITAHIVEVKVRVNKDIGITTEIALLLTFSLGAWSAFGYTAHSLGVAVIVVTLLSLKPVMHRWLRKIEVEEIYAGIKLLIISFILLPLLPNEGYGPGQTLNPYWIWWMVVLISGLSFVGYILMKYLGERRGTLLTAITGGLASSLAVTLSMAQFSRQQKHTSNHIFIAGVLIASAVMFARVAIEVGIVNSTLLHPLWIPLAAMLIVAVLGTIWLLTQSRKLTDSQHPFELSNPLQLFTAIKFGLLLAIILLLTTAMEIWFGDEGIYLLSFISGLIDVDAITLSLSHMAGENISPRVATSGIIISVIANTLVKAGLFIFLTGLERSKALVAITLLIVASGIISLFLIFTVIG